MALGGSPWDVRAVRMLCKVLLSLCSTAFSCSSTAWPPGLPVAHRVLGPVFSSVADCHLCAELCGALSPSRGKRLSPYQTLCNRWGPSRVARAPMCGAHCGGASVPISPGATAPPLTCIQSLGPGRLREAATSPSPTLKAGLVVPSANQSKGSPRPSGGALLRGSPALRPTGVSRAATL